MWDDNASISGPTSGTGDENTTISGTLSAIDTADGLTDGSYWTIFSQPSNGSANIGSSSGTWNYTPVNQFAGNDNFIVRLTDDDGHTQDVPINVTVVSVSNLYRFEIDLWMLFEKVTYTWNWYILVFLTLTALLFWICRCID